VVRLAPVVIRVLLEQAPTMDATPTPLASASS